MIESGPNAWNSTTIHGSYQQWTVLGQELSYCGLLTQDGGKHYLIAQPQFWYQPQLSSEYEVIFCADPRGGGCNTFWWQWQYDKITNKLLSNNTVGGVPHELTYFNQIPNINTNDIPIDIPHRQKCAQVLGEETPYNYDWLKNGPLEKKWGRFDSDSRQEFKDNIPNYRQYYEHRRGYNHDEI